MAADKPYRKLGGWLLVYVIAEAVLNLGVPVNGIQDSLAETDTTKQIVMLVAFALFTFLFYLPLIWMLRLDWRGVRLARIWHIIGVITSVIWLVVWLFQLSPGLIAMGSIWSMVFSLITSGIALAYLLRSSRVNRDTAWHHHRVADEPVAAQA